MHLLMVNIPVPAMPDISGSLIYIYSFIYFRLTVVKSTKTLSDGLELPKYMSMETIGKKFSEAGYIDEDTVDIIIESWCHTLDYKSMFKSKRVILPTSVARLLEPGKEDIPSEVSTGHGQYEYNVASKAEELRTILGGINLTKANLVCLCTKPTSCTEQIIKILCIFYKPFRTNR